MNTYSYQCSKCGYIQSEPDPCRKCLPVDPINEAIAVHYRWWVKNVERRQDILHMKDHELFIDGDYIIMLVSEWHSLKESLEKGIENGK